MQTLNFCTHHDKVRHSKCVEKEGAWNINNTIIVQCRRRPLSVSVVRNIVGRSHVFVTSIYLKIQLSHVTAGRPWHGCHSFPTPNNFMLPSIHPYRNASGFLFNLNCRQRLLYPPPPPSLHDARTISVVVSFRRTSFAANHFEALCFYFFYLFLVHSFFNWFTFSFFTL